LSSFGHRVSASREHFREGIIPGQAGLLAQQGVNDDKYVERGRIIDRLAQRAQHKYPAHSAYVRQLQNLRNSAARSPCNLLSRGKLPRMRGLRNARSQRVLENLIFLSEATAEGDLAAATDAALKIAVT